MKMFKDAWAEFQKGFGSIENLQRMSDFTRAFAVFSIGLTVSFFVTLFLLDLPAIAQTAPAVSGGVDFGPLATNIITASAAILSVAAGVLSKFGVSFLASRVRMQDSEMEKLAADRVNDILHRAIDYAEAWAKTQVADPNSIVHHVRIDNFFLAEATKYAIAAMPDLIKMFNLTEDRIKAMLLSRMNAIMPVPVLNSGTINTFAQAAVDNPISTQPPQGN